MVPIFFYLSFWMLHQDMRCSLNFLFIVIRDFGLYYLNNFHISNIFSVVCAHFVHFVLFATGFIICYTKRYKLGSTHITFQYFTLFLFKQLTLHYLLLFSSLLLNLDSCQLEVEGQMGTHKFYFVMFQKKQFMILLIKELIN